MRYFVTIGGRTLEVEISGGRVVVDGREMDAELASLPGTPLRHLLLDGASYGVLAEGGEDRGEWRLRVDGHALVADVVDERTRAIRALTGAAAGPQGPKPIRAPMPGMVVRLEIEPGQEVRAGQGVIIVEAMKMENELKAEAPGVVARILVEPGQAVEKGAILVEFEAAS